MALFDGKYLTSYLMAIVMFYSICHHLQDFAKIIKCQKC